MNIFKKIRNIIFAYWKICTPEGYYHGLLVQGRIRIWFAKQLFPRKKEELWMKTPKSYFILTMEPRTLPGGQNGRSMSLISYIRILTRWTLMTTHRLSLSSHCFQEISWLTYTRIILLLLHETWKIGFVNSLKIIIISIRILITTDWPLPKKKTSIIEIVARIRKISIRGRIAI